MNQKWKKNLVEVEVKRTIKRHKAGFSLVKGVRVQRYVDVYVIQNTWVRNRNRPEHRYQW